MKLIKDYDCTIAYHPRKANALTRKSPNSRSRGRLLVLKELRGVKAVLNAGTSGNLRHAFRLSPYLKKKLLDHDL